MTDDNDKPKAPVISLASVRGAARNVSEERQNLKNEGRELKLDSEIVTAAVEEALLGDWLCDIAQRILQRFEEHPATPDIVKLASQLRDGIEWRKH